jgi:hypothetical protein
MSAPVPVTVMFDGADLLESRATAVPDPVIFDAAARPAVRASESPPTPVRDLDRTIAHLLLTCEVNAGHLRRHAAAAQAASTPDGLVHNLRHAKNHTTVIAEHQEKIRQALTERVPAVGREMELLSQVSGTDAAGTGTRYSGQSAKTGADLDRGLAHDLTSAMVATGHVYRHLTEAQTAPDPASAAFNLQHAVNHAAEIAHYHQGLQDGLVQRLPAVGPELNLLRGLAGVSGPTTIPVIPLDGRSASRPPDPVRGHYGGGPVIPLLDERSAGWSPEPAGGYYDITPPDRGPQPA